MCLRIHLLLLLLTLLLLHTLPLAGMLTVTHTVQGNMPRLDTLAMDLLALDYQWHVYACAPTLEFQVPPCISLVYSSYHGADKQAVLQAMAEYVCLVPQHKSPWRA